jgi:hypothetical protein
MASLTDLFPFIAVIGIFVALAVAAFAFGVDSRSSFGENHNR